jgi:hypothetical protein
VAVGIAGRGDDVKLPAIERMGSIGHFEVDAGAIRVVEGGINIGYRSTLWIMLICGNFSGTGYATGCCYV